MTKQFRIAGLPPASSLGTFSATVGGQSDSTTVSTFLRPATITDLPRLSDNFSGDTAMSVDVGSLTNVTNYDFREVGGASLQTGATATFDTTGHGGKWVEVRVTADPASTLYTSPPILIRMTMAGMSAAMIADDRAILAILPHNQITHLAVADGDWTDPATWRNGRVPRTGSKTLIPYGRTVTYDVSEQNIRLDRIRVDGRLDFARDQDTHMLVETVITTAGAISTIGESNATRLPSQYACDIVISGKDIRANTYLPTDLNSSVFVGTRGWERGIVSQGTWRMWGAKKTVWAFAEDAVPLGATSLTFAKDMEGLAVGDTIIIGGTRVGYTHSGTQERGLDLETEERQITGISGRTVSWSDPLIHDHGNPLTGNTREDIVPPVMVKNNKNIVIRSEVTGVEWQRGHTACMHHHARMDFWDVAFIGLGRTSKDRHWDGIVDPDDGTKFKSMGTSDVVTSTDLTNRANLQGRYPVHGHLLGHQRPESERSIVSGCYVEDTPGAGMVHHDCDMDFFNNGIYRFFGVGMLAEQGSEIGAWVNNCAMHATWVGRINPFKPNAGIPNLRSGPKTLESTAGSRGLGARMGYGFYYRGRAIRGNGNVACGVSHGHVFYARTAGNQIVPVTDAPRSALDISEAGVILNTAVSVTQGNFDHVDYPILHMADNYAIGCLGGTFVTKQRVSQDHDVNVKIKRPRSYGMDIYGITVEYVGVYILDRPDVVGSGSGLTGGGVNTGAQAMQVAIMHPRVDTGGDTAVGTGQKTTGGGHDLFDDVNDSRWMIVGVDNPDGGYVGGTGTQNNTKTAAEVTFKHDDWDDQLIDYDRDPSDTYSIAATPSVFGRIPGTGLKVVDVPDRFDPFYKSDNQSDFKRVIRKNNGDYIIPGGHEEENDRVDVRTYRDAVGFWEYDVGSGTEHFVRMPYVMSDALTGRPAKSMVFIKQTDGDDVGTNNGPLIRAATPVTANPFINATVAKNGSVTVDVLALAAPSGAGGAGTYTVETGKGAGDMLGADYGRASVDPTTGVVTYRPDLDYEGTDECYVFIRSQNRWATVRIDFLIGSAGTGLETPVSGTHFTASPGAAGEIVIDTRRSTGHSAPDADMRRIDLVEYSTDNGATWRRLCNAGWIPDLRAITKRSDSPATGAGTALTAGSYNVRLRYKTDFEYGRSTASSAVSVTVT